MRTVLLLLLCVQAAAFGGGAIFNVYIDGAHGTTGLQVRDRLENRKDIQIIDIPEKLRKEPAERRRYITEKADAVILCLPDEGKCGTLSFAGTFIRSASRRPVFLHILLLHPHPNPHPRLPFVVATYPIPTFSFTFRAPVAARWFRPHPLVSWDVWPPPPTGDPSSSSCFPSLPPFLFAASSSSSSRH